MIAAKANEPAFRELKERLDANINWPRYLPILKVRPTGVTSWLVLLPSGKEHIIGDEDWQAAVTVDSAQPSAGGEKTSEQWLQWHIKALEAEFGPGSYVPVRTPDAAQAASEPVAWRWKFEDETSWTLTKVQPTQYPDMIIEPLYTQPKEP